MQLIHEEMPYDLILVLMLDQHATLTFDSVKISIDLRPEYFERGAKASTS